MRLLTKDSVIVRAAMDSRVWRSSERYRAQQDVEAVRAHLETMAKRLAVLDAEIAEIDAFLRGEGFSVAELADDSVQRLMSDSR
jgi:glutathione S-transferase